MLITLERVFILESSPAVAVSFGRREGIVSPLQTFSTWREMRSREAGAVVVLNLGKEIRFEGFYSRVDLTSEHVEDDTASQGCF